MLKVGSTAPSFSGKDQHGTEISLESLSAKGHVVLYFYPKDFTPGCTIEACSFRDAYDELAAEGVTVVGVSTDSAESHRAFAQEYRLQFSLLPDKDRTISKAYEVVGYFGLGTQRVTYLIDKTRTIRGAFRHELMMNKHVAQVKQALAAL